MNSFSHVSHRHLFVQALFVVCHEAIKKFPNHPILSPGVTVQIGLGKSTRLESVFERYVKVCKTRDPASREITVNDLEFVHSTVLKGSETYEQAALMKDDRIRVRGERSLAAQQEKERNKIQRESDLHYFTQMKSLLRPDPVLAQDTVLLDCCGTLPNNSQPRVRFLVPCIVSLASHRCSWLRRKIEVALANQKPEDLDQKRRFRADRWLRPSNSQDTARSSAISHGRDANTAFTKEEDDEEPIQMVDRNQNDDERVAAAAAAAPVAAEIEMEGEDQDTEDEAMEEMETRRVVTIEDHPPEAMILLLEYCYSNRVPSLGIEAFKIAAETKLLSREYQGNVPPFPVSSGAKRWPNRGEPTVTFEMALACMELAEEADMPRLSLMCEVAASQLVQSSNVVSALTVCSRIQKETGNEFSRLRQAAMDVVLHAKRSVTDKSAFRQALQEESKLLVPTLLQGLVQSMTERMDRRSLYEYENRDWQTTAYAYFDQCDRDDDYKRNRERRQRRIERHPEGEQPIVVDEYEALATRKSLKRARAGGHSFRSVLRRTEKRDRRNSH